jgi:quercetin dioxygenase-like cupin family protein
MSCLQHGTDEITCGDFKLRLFQFNEPGRPECPPHTHDFDHMTLCLEGRVRVQLHNADGSLDADMALGSGGCIHVPAEALHSVWAITPGARAACIFVNHGTDRDTL